MPDPLTERERIERQEARIVREQQDAYDMGSGPYGYERVGFAIGERVFWTGLAASGLPPSHFNDGETLAQEVVRRWNRG